MKKVITLVEKINDEKINANNIAINNVNVAIRYQVGDHLVVITTSDLQIVQNLEENTTDVYPHAAFPLYIPFDRVVVENNGEEYKILYKISGFSKENTVIVRKLTCVCITGGRLFVDTTNCHLTISPTGNIKVSSK